LEEKKTVKIVSFFPFAVLVCEKRKKEGKERKIGRGKDREKKIWFYVLWKHLPKLYNFTMLGL